MEAIKMKKRMLVISGFSGVGKGTVAKKLVEGNSDMSLVTSLTTRKPRYMENEYDYHFVTGEEFQEAERNGELLECNTYEENRYGTPVKEVEGIWEQGKIPVLEIDANGYEAVRKHPALKECDIIGVFLTISGDELFTRLQGRRTESYEKIIRRMLIAKDEVKAIEQYDCVLENDTVEVTVKRIEDYIRCINRSSDNFDKEIFVHKVDEIIRKIKDTNSI